jgi:hypothetical protein
VGIIQGFYQLRAKTNPSYMLYYTGSGSPVMRTGGYDGQNRSIWMLWQPSDTDSSYVQLISATNSNYDNASIYKMLTSSSVMTAPFNTYELTNNTTITPTIITNVLQTATSTTSMAMWIMTKTGTTTWGGATRDVVTFKMPYNNKYLYYGDAISDANTSLTIHESSGSDYWEFILEPVTPYYSDLTAPTNLRLQTSTSGTSTKTLDWWTQSAMYWSWTDSQNTINAGDQHTYRIRTFTVNNAGTTTYTDWSSYKDQSSADWKTSGTKRWMNTAVTIPSVSGTIKATGTEIQMLTLRKFTALGRENRFQSLGTGSGSCKFAKKPTLTKDGLSWTPDGMKINFTSNYFGQGTLQMTFTGIKASNKSILSKSYTTSIVKDTTVTIPQSYFTRVPKDGESVTLTIRLNTDVYAPNNYSVNISDTLTYDEGTVDVTPTVTQLDGLRFKADVPYANTVKMWMSVDGVNTELEGTVSNGHTIFEITPPFGGKEYGIFTSYENSDKTVWGTDYTDMPTINIRAHAFTWSGGSVIIWLNKDDALQEGFTFSPQSTTHTLAGRSHDVVTYLSDGEKNYTSVTGDIKGYIVPQLETYGTTRDSIEKLVEQGHVVYRAPYGRVCNVAVTGADINTDVGITEVSISIVQEDDD